MRTGIQRNQTCFHHRSIPFHSQRIELQLHGEAQRTVVQHLLRLVAPRIDNGIIHHQCRHSSSQCWTYCIAVHAITVVYMIGECAYQLIGCLRVCLAQFINLLPGVCIQFLGIHVFQYRCSSASLRKQVVAETAFTPCLQCRTVGTEAYQVVLPGHVVQTFGIIAAAGNYIIRVGSTGLDSISGCTIRFHRNRENNLLIIRHLIRNLLSVYVKHHNLRCIGQFQLGNDIAHRHFNHLSRTL